MLCKNNGPSRITYGKPICLFYQPVLMLARRNQPNPATKILRNLNNKTKKIILFVVIVFVKISSKHFTKQFYKVVKLVGGRSQLGQTNMIKPLAMLPNPYIANITVTFLKRHAFLGKIDFFKCPYDQPILFNGSFVGSVISGAYPV